MNEGASLLPVKVVPGASRTRCMGEWQGRLKVAVAAAPEKGRANEALTEFLAGELGLRKQQVVVSAGHGSPLKTIRIEGASPDAIRAALGLLRS